MSRHHEGPSHDGVPSALSGASPRTIAVLDVGKTNVKLVLFDGAADREVWTRTMPNTVRRDGLYPHVDTARIQAFFIDGLADLVRESEGGLDAISVTAHGATGALIGPDELALPVLDYEYDGPDRLSEAYAAIRPAFAETFSPRLPGGLNLGAQLFWQERLCPDRFAAASAFVTYPQYWSWWLTGIASNEPTSLGAHTDLWAAREGRFSSLIEQAGWTVKMAPLRSAFDILGPVRPAIGRRVGLTTPVPVTCGIHDSNASLLPHLQGASDPVSVVSTGTWAIVFAVGGSLDLLDASRDTLANVDAFGRPTPSARFMGGREFDLLTGTSPVIPDEACVAAVIDRGLMALPTFAPGNGPFPRGEGRWSHDPATLSAAERTAVASLYAALMTATCLDLLKAQGPTIIEGPFGRNALICAALAASTGRPVVVSANTTGTSAGAARLVMRGGRGVPLAATVALPPDLQARFAGYAQSWRRSVS